MFGYIRPLKGELKVSQYESFASVYCGLCRALKKKYGFLARFMVNYDFTFLIMLLCGSDTEVTAEHKRCPASPLRKKCCRTASSVSELAADYCIILYYWKLRDAVEDEGFLARLYLRPLAFMFRGRYKKASVLRGGFNDAVERNIAELSELERCGETSIDAAADKFARILESAAESLADKSTRIVTGKLLYHIGRLLYILDACDDLRADTEKGRYNPVAARFGIKDGNLDDADKEWVRMTLNHSVSVAAADFELLPRSEFTDILANIIYLGLPRVIELVLNGQFDAKAGGRKRRSSE